MAPMDPAWLPLPERFVPRARDDEQVLAAGHAGDAGGARRSGVHPPHLRGHRAPADARAPAPDRAAHVLGRRGYPRRRGAARRLLRPAPRACRPYALDSRYLTTQFHAGYTATFPMPFQHAARIEVEAGPSVEDAGILMQIDWHAYPSESPPTLLRFHVAVPARVPLRGLRTELPAARRRRPGPLPGLQLRRGRARRPGALVARGRRERLCDERRRRPGGTLRPSARRGRRGHVWRLLRRRAAPTVHASRPGRALLRPGRHRPGPRPAHAVRVSVLRGRRHPLRAVNPGAVRVDGERHLQHGVLVPGTAPPAVQSDAGVGPTPAGRGAAVRRHRRAGSGAALAAAGSVPS